MTCLCRKSLAHHLYKGMPVCTTCGIDMILWNHEMREHLAEQARILLDRHTALDQLMNHLTEEE